MNKKYDIQINISKANLNSTEIEIEIENYCKFIFNRPIIGCFSNIQSDGLIIKRYNPKLFIAVYGAADVVMTVPIYTTKKNAIKICNELYNQFVEKYDLCIRPKNKELNNKIGFIK